MPSSVSEISLPEDCTIQQAASLHGQIRQALEQGGGLLLDAGAVATVDAAAMQLFWALRREAGGRLRWRNVGEPLRRAAFLLGMGGLLDGRE